MKYLKIRVTIFASLLFYAEADYNTTLSDRDGKLLGIGVGFAQFANSVCTAANGLLGTCYRQRQCEDLPGGSASGTCARGLGRCCVVQMGCGTSSSHNNTYIVNGGFPAPFYGSVSCMHTIQRCSSEICQVRIDFLTLSLAQPNAQGLCTTDSLEILGAAAPTPVICGENSGQHMYLSFYEGSNIDIVITTSSIASFPRSWNIRISQLECDSPSLAPPGCLMYYYGATGTVKSFNYGTTVNNNLKPDSRPGTREMVNLNYGVCIGPVPGFCSIRWSQTAGDPYSFSVTQNTIGLAVAPGLPTGSISGRQCTTDYVVVPNPNGRDADRYCGNQFPTMTSAARPFVLTVITDADEELDIGNRGFSLTYAQQRCTII